MSVATGAPKLWPMSRTRSLRALKHGRERTAASLIAHGVFGFGGAEAGAIGDDHFARLR